MADDKDTNVKRCEWCSRPIPKGENYSRKVYCSRKCSGASRTMTPEQILFGPGRYIEQPAPTDRPLKGPCWIWQGQINQDGYGRATQMGPKNLSTSAHAAAYMVLKGPVPGGLELDHLCRVRACINPDHLEPVTHHENMLRGKQATLTHCKRGHEFTPENTKVSMNMCGNPGRTCLACAQLAYLKRYQKHPKPVTTHCVNGHAFDEVNTYIFVDKNGKRHRQCKACQKIWNETKRKPRKRVSSATALGRRGEPGSSTA